LPSRISTILPPGSVGALMPAASRVTCHQTSHGSAPAQLAPPPIARKARVARLVTRIALNTITNCFACLYMLAILS
jgi:hypothetical protein